MFLEELIEKAFCEGYKCAQKKLYSNSDEEDKKEDSEKSNKRKKKKIPSGLVGAALTAGGLALNGAAGQKFYEDLNKEHTEKSKKLYEKLKEDIKNRKVKFDDTVDIENAAYSPKMKGVRDSLAKLGKELRKSNQSKDFLGVMDSLRDGTRKAYGKKYNLGKNSFIIGKKFKGKADILAHEMGHEHYMDGKGKKSLGGVLHNTVIRNPLIGTAHGIAAGVHSGFKSEKEKYKGKKESKWNKYKSAIIPGIHAGFLVGSEAAASLHGYKKLKELGADKETLRDARKTLGNALGTYVGVGAVQVGSGLISRSVGKGIGKAYYGVKKALKGKKKEEKQNKKEED